MVWKKLLTSKEGHYTICDYVIINDNINSKNNTYHNPDEIT